MPKITRKSRIEEEKKRLLKHFDGINEDRKQVALGLIGRCAVLRIQIEEFEKDIEENGVTENFRQSEKVKAYTRERPTFRIYKNSISLYQSVIKQLTSLLPKEEIKNLGDGFDEL